jgi:hypothetical protein
MEVIMRNILVAFAYDNIKELAETLQGNDDVSVFEFEGADKQTEATIYNSLRQFELMEFAHKSKNKKAKKD